MDERVHVMTSGALPLAQAQQLMDALDEAVSPGACAVSMNETDEAHALWQVQAYYEGAPDEAELARLAEAAVGGSVILDVRPAPQTNWVAESLKGLAPVRAGRFFVHGRHDRARRPGHGVALEIDAGVAFGTGHHGTTSGCLLALDRILKRRCPARVLDVGCGTGVLGIAAARTGSEMVIMSDIDPQAVATAQSNARLNRVTDRVRVVEAAGLSHSEIWSAGAYDLVFANILARPLIKLAPAIMQAVRPGGHVVLSGLYTDQERQVFAAYRACAGVLIARIRQDRWSTLWLEKRS